METWRIITLAVLVLIGLICFACHIGKKSKRKGIHEMMEPVPWYVQKQNDISNRMEDVLSEMQWYIDEYYDIADKEDQYNRILADAHALKYRIEKLYIDTTGLNTGNWKDEQLFSLRTHVILFIDTAKERKEFNYTTYVNESDNQDN